MPNTNPLYAMSCVILAFLRFCNLLDSLQLQAKKEALLHIQSLT